MRALRRLTIVEVVLFALVSALIVVLPDPPALDVLAIVLLLIALGATVATGYLLRLLLVVPDTRHDWLYVFMALAALHVTGALWAIGYLAIRRFDGSDPLPGMLGAQIIGFAVSLAGMVPILMGALIAAERHGAARARSVARDTGLDRLEAAIDENTALTVEVANMVNEKIAATGDATAAAVADALRRDLAAVARQVGADKVQAEVDAALRATIDETHDRVVEVHRRVVEGDGS